MIQLQFGRQSQIMTLMSAMPSFRPLISTCGWKVDEKPGGLIRACQKDLQKVQDRLIAWFVSLFDFWVVETGGVSTNLCKREQRMIGWLTCGILSNVATFIRPLKACMNASTISLSSCMDGSRHFGMVTEGLSASSQDVEYCNTLPSWG